MILISVPSACSILVTPFVEVGDWVVSSVPAEKSRGTVEQPAALRWLADPLAQGGSGDHRFGKMAARADAFETLHRALDVTLGRLRALASQAFRHQPAGPTLDVPVALGFT